MPGHGTKFNLKRLDGVFGYSVFSGFLLSVLVFAGVDVSETGILVGLLESVADTLGSPSPYLVPAVSILATASELAVIAISIKRISEHGYAGAVVSGTGFFGTILVFAGTMVGLQAATYAGVAMWAAGVAASRLAR